MVETDLRNWSNKRRKTTSGHVSSQEEGGRSRVQKPWLLSRYAATGHLYTLQPKFQEENQGFRRSNLFLCPLTVAFISCEEFFSHSLLNSLKHFSMVGGKFTLSLSHGRDWPEELKQQKKKNHVRSCFFHDPNLDHLVVERAPSA